MSRSPAESSRVTACSPIRYTAVDSCRLARAEPTSAATIDCTSSSAVCSSPSSSFIRLPSRCAAARNSVISPEITPRATPWSRTILRKKKSWAWIAVVPS